MVAHDVMEGETLPQRAAAVFGQDMLDDGAARRWFLHQIHPHGPVCPKCGAREFSARQVLSFDNDGRVKCGACAAYFCNRTGTVLEGSTLDWRGMYLLLALVALGVEIKRVAGIVGVHAETVLRLVRKIEGHA